MKPVRIGIIDSGLNTRFELKVVASLGFSADTTRVSETAVSPDLLGHGTEVTRIINQGCSGNEFCIAQVFTRSRRCTPAQVGAAIRWLVDQQVSLINMSFGLLDDRDILRQACEFALHQGIALIAASPPRGRQVFPAGYPNIIRATGDARCNQGDVSYLHSLNADFGGKVQGSNLQIRGSSIGCAHVTAKCASLLQADAGMETTQLVAQLIKVCRFSDPEVHSGRN